MTCVRRVGGVLALTFVSSCQREPASDANKAPLAGTELVASTTDRPFWLADPKGGAGWDLSRGYARFIPGAGLLVTLGAGAVGCARHPKGKPFVTFELAPGPADTFFAREAVRSAVREAESAEEMSYAWQVSPIVTVVEPFPLRIGERIRGSLRLEGHFHDMNRPPLVSEGTFEASICAESDDPGAARAGAPRVEDVRGSLRIGARSPKRALLEKSVGRYHLVLAGDRIGCDDLSEYGAARTIVSFDSFPIESTSRVVPATGAKVSGTSFAMSARHPGWVKIDRPADPRKPVRVRVALRLAREDGDEDVRGEITARLCP